MAAEKDIFGFDELNKSFSRFIKKFPEKTDAVLMTYGKAAQKDTKQKTPVHSGAYSGKKAKQKPGDLKKSWRLQKVKKYQGGKISVVRVRSTDPKAHLIEDGHKIYTAPRGLSKKATKYNAVTQKIIGVKQHGKTEGIKMLEKSMKETEKAFVAAIGNALDDAIDEEGLGE